MLDAPEQGAKPEKWRSLGFNGYTVSGSGAVQNKRGTVLKPTMRKGTPHVQMRKTKNNWVPVAKLVLLAFRGGIRGAHPNFRDGDLTNVREANLYWGMRAQIVYCNRNKVVESTDNTGQKKRYPSIMQAVREDGYSQSAISKCCSGESRTHKGLRWRCLNEKM